MMHHPLKAVVQEQLPSKRYEHTLLVVQTSVLLAQRFGVCEESSVVAALLHDIAKNQSEAFLKQKLQGSAYLDYSPLVWHAPVGAILAKENYNVLDEDILNAIKYHTTGRPAMSKLEEVIFVADYIEPNRTQPGVEVIRQLANHSLEAAVAQTLSDTIAYLRGKKNGNIHPDTLAAYDYYHQYLL